MLLVTVSGPDPDLAPGAAFLVTPGVVPCNGWAVTDFDHCPWHIPACLAEG